MPLYLWFTPTSTPCPPRRIAVRSAIGLRDNNFGESGSAVHQANRRVEDLEIRPIGADDCGAMSAR